MLKTINVSENKCNYSQRNNKIDPCSTCGTTNMIQALDYCGWEFPKDNTLTQPEDCFTKFCRSNDEVLEYYKTKYPSMYNNWMQESFKLFGKGKSINETNFKSLIKSNNIWKEHFPESFPPNEVHDVLNFAANKWLGYDKDEITYFKENSTEEEIDKSLLDGRPVVSSVKFGNWGHIITIVGIEFEAKTKYANSLSDVFYDFEHFDGPETIKNYIIDNTYGRFNFDTMKYDAVSGNDEKIERHKFLSMLKPIGCPTINAHFFKKGPATL